MSGGETRELIERARDDAKRLMPLGPRDTRYLIAVCEELLKEHPEKPCELRGWNRTCLAHYKDLPIFWCQPCRDRALMERCDRAARGEK